MKMRVQEMVLRFKKLEEFCDNVLEVMEKQTELSRQSTDLIKELVLRLKLQNE